MKICVLLAHYEKNDSPLAEVDIPYDPAPFLARHKVAFHYLEKGSAVQQVEALSRQGFDLFINLYDGSMEEHMPGVEVVQELERLGMPFTGAYSDFIEPTRRQVKDTCLRLGLPSPAFAFVCTLEEATQAASSLRFPLIIKHPNSFCSVGLTPHSRVVNSTKLLEQVAQMIAAYGSALVEEFIEGREFTVLVVENSDDPSAPLVYRPNEIHFPPDETFKHFNLKWVNYNNMISAPVTDPELDARLRDLTRQIFLGMRGSGYARCDIRMNGQEELFILDVNPNCGLYYPLDAPGAADLILMQSPGGHQAFTCLLLRSAWQRLGRPIPGDL